MHYPLEDGLYVSVYFLVHLGVDNRVYTAVGRRRNKQNVVKSVDEAVAWIRSIIQIQVTCIEIEDGIRHGEYKVHNNNYDKHPHCFSILLVSLLHCPVIVMYHCIGSQCASCEAIGDNNDEVRDDS